MLGATGYTGRLVVEQARALDIPVRLVGRRREALEALEAHCSPYVTVSKPDGGFFLWVELADEVDGGQVMMNGIADGVVCRPGERFFGEKDAGKQFFRLAFTQVPVSEIERGIAVLGKAINASIRTSS